MKAFFLTLLLILPVGYSLKVLATPRTDTQAQKSTNTAATKTTASDPGEQKFRENCGRCHVRPDSLSPREVKAVVQHMRVRAMLSAEEERLILKYLAP